MAGHKKAENSASGSDMSTVSATWSYILPSLNYIMRDPVPGPQPDNRAPILPVAQHSSIYTVVYNFATASRTGISGVPGFGMTGATGMRDGFDPDKEASMDKFERVRAMIGYELYSLLDDYFRDLAREIRLNAPLPNFTTKATASPVPTTLSKSSTRKGKAKATVPSGQAKDQSHQAFGDELVLVEYYCKAYTRFSSGAAQINRLFAYLNRHFIMRAIDEGCGWISLADVVAASVLKDLASVTISDRKDSNKVQKREKSLNAALTSTKKTKEDLKKLEARKHAEWRKWGYDAETMSPTDSSTPEEKKYLEQLRRIAELCAEAASDTERIVTCSALAMRSWRLEVAEPLLDPAYWNTNGQHDVWARSPPIPPTPLAPGERERNKVEDEGEMKRGSITVPLVVGTGGKEEEDRKGKGKGKGKGTGHHHSTGLALSIPVQVPASGPNSFKANGKDSHSGRSSPQDATQEGRSPTSPSGETKSPVSAPKAKKIMPRKGGNSAPTSLAAVRAATAAKTAAREAEESGQGAVILYDPSIATKSRLSRAVTYLLDSKTLSKSASTPTPSGSIQENAEDEALTKSDKIQYASMVADSLMMSGLSPDHGVRRRLDRFLGKVREEEGESMILVPKARW
ncbi:hypothetical protein M407DRAFT_7084 [Tulasnella calospora MUT 4182]|uniref:Uncharacterized protein n=1 Tax=Tulasnella calospora MUT 4182 TaxID=1051891 RepID=A0A0C3QBI8_9AGAM|nr:hypothetical protein M407DRAFT_7084 [Tulasnella calospora MUT 4182]